jgi:uncharacterized membrane protein
VFGGVFAMQCIMLVWKPDMWALPVLISSAVLFIPLSFFIALIAMLA